MMLASLSGTNYVPNEHEDVDQHDPYDMGHVVQHHM